MKVQLLLVAMLFAVCIASAQNHFFEGYIVKAAGDTVKGYIKEDMSSHLSNQVMFKAHASEDATPFTVKDVRAFAFENNIFRALNYFDEVDSVQKEQFGKLLVEGYYSLYALYYGVAGHYFYVTSQQGKNFFLYDDLLEPNYVKRSANFRNHLYFIGQSCPNAMSRVESMTFTEKDVANFVQHANNCLEPGKPSSLHFKKAKTELVGIYLFAGGLSLDNGRNQLMGQIMARFVSPSISRKASFNVGFEYLRNSGPFTTTVSSLSTEEDHEVTEIYSVPFLLQYNFTRGWFQPYVCTGISVMYKIDKQIDKLTSLGYESTGIRSNSEVGPSFPFAVGVEVYPIKHLLIKAEYRYDIFLQYPVVGLGIKF